MIKDTKIAVLIDGDNIPSKYITEMMEEIAKYGTPTIKRIYGDWTKPHLNKWKNVLLENAITPIQQYGYTTGKNATDSAMIIDAMDILYSEKVNGFCTPKVIRLLKNSVDDAADDDGWAFLGDVGSLILKKQPNFDSRNFGYAKLTPLFKSLSQLLRF